MAETCGCANGSGTSEIAPISPATVCLKTKLKETAETAILTEAVEIRKRLAWGRTVAGRYLLVVYALRGQQRAYIITARDMTSNEKRRLRRRTGR